MDEVMEIARSIYKTYEQIFQESQTPREPSAEQISEIKGFCLQIAIAAHQIASVQPKKPNEVEEELGESVYHDPDVGPVLRVAGEFMEEIQKELQKKD